MKKISLGFAFFAFLTMASCANDSNTSQSSTSSSSDDISWTSGDSYSSPFTEESTSETSSIAVLEKTPLEKEVAFTDGTKETAKLKIVEATTDQSAFPDHMISLEDYDTKKMVAVKIEYTNVALDEPFLPYAQYFQAYDQDGKALVQVNQQNGQDAVPVGRTGVTQLFWELPVEGDSFDKFEIDFVPSDRVATFELNVSH